MNILLLGGGGREHALAWRLARSPRLKRLYALPGSDGMRPLAECLAGDSCDAAAVVAAAARQRIDLVVVGPEAPLAAGVSDALRAAGVAVFGPSRIAAQLETSKFFAKRFMQRHHIPTAGFMLCDSLAEAERALVRFPLPVVLKADGLAAGKGVLIAATQAEARAALAALFSGHLVGDAGRRVVIEECLRGPELSLLALCDGERARLLPPARDHKRVGEGDSGPNTGGMGAISDDALLSPALADQVRQEVIEPVLAGMAEQQAPFQGVLYCGLMLTPAGPRVLEFNARFGDPETQPLMLRCDGDLAGALLAAAQGALAPASVPAFSPEPAACVVLAAQGYPGPYARDRVITGLEEVAAAGEAIVFHAGTRFAEGAWRTTGGRVLAVAARAATLDAALARCYAAAGQIHFQGMHYRRDIGRTLAGA